MRQRQPVVGPINKGANRGRGGELSTTSNWALRPPASRARAICSSALNLWALPALVFAARDLRSPGMMKIYDCPDFKKNRGRVIQDQSEASPPSPPTAHDHSSPLAAVLNGRHRRHSAASWVSKALLQRTDSATTRRLSTLPLLGEFASLEPSRTSAAYSARAQDLDDRPVQTDSPTHTQPTKKKKNSPTRLPLHTGLGRHRRPLPEDSPRPSGLGTPAPACLSSAFLLLLKSRPPAAVL